MRLLIFLLLFLPTTFFAQVYVDKYDINADDKVQFVEVSFRARGLNPNVVCFDYGQKLGRKQYWTRIFGNDKKEVVFNSMMHILNFMVANGWEVFDGPYPATENVLSRCIFVKAEK